VRHPIQPMVTDAHGVIRFKENAIVRYLLDNGGIDLNKIALLPFSGEDREQFAQLIGYSVSGFGDLSYVRADTLDVVDTLQQSGVYEHEARINVLERKLAVTRRAIRTLVPQLFDMAPEDFDEIADWPPDAEHSEPSIGGYVYVIQDGELPDYWSNDDGWGDYDSATRFTAVEQARYSLPIGASQSVWRRVD
jgi:hypothetical protein